MIWLNYFSYFFAGLFLANAVPHSVAGAMGEAFQTPFAKPPGNGLSSSTVNVVWGFFNLAVGYMLLLQVGNFDLRAVPDVAALGLGAFLITLFSARNFGKLHGGNLAIK